ncbi:MAG: alpha/beta fold hydrolase [Phenylobacterium sp.]|uniref:alpha/beta fold hydrolase n=1 Tax=Phenylobacterium sp. TaxID=1871053 RepID=UPI00271AFD56|nr:alpha/beta fold hydrolase [Phenylobacterium sp.]MDO8902129.1 alpha/beta fold hydrolase [Phenylobacterium sp.]
MPPSRTPKADVAQLIETIYAVAARPERWEEIISAVGAAAAAGPAAGAALSHLPGLDDVGPETKPALGVILLSPAGGVVGWNSVGEAMFRDRLGVVESRGLRFFNPSNHEALAHARARLAESGAAQVIVKFIQARDDDPHFAYMAPISATPPEMVADIAHAGNASAALIFPALEASDHLWRTIRESFGLTPAETRLAARLKDGLTLKEAAEDLNVSLNTVRNQLRAVFEKMGLNRQSDLVRALAQLSALSSSLQPVMPSTVSATEAGALRVAPPVLIHRLADRRALAYRVYGDPTGRPCMMVHQGLGSSLLPRGSDQLARDLGLYIVCAERPGTGRSDPRLDLSFHTVAEDLVALTEALGLSRMRIVAFMNGAAFALAYAGALGDRAERLLLVSGRRSGVVPETERDRRHPMILLHRRMARSAWAVGPLYALLRRRLSRRQVEAMVRTAASAPGDGAYLRSHPAVAEFVYDYMSECLARSSKGAARELVMASDTPTLDLPDLSAPISVWFGADDPAGPPDDFLAWLGRPCKEVRILPAVGHFLPHKHWPEVMAWLAADEGD